MSNLFSESLPTDSPNYTYPDTHTNGHPRSPSAEPVSTQHDHRTPNKQQPRSGSRLPSPPPPDINTSINSPHVLTPTSELGSLQWSAAVGRATTGKSGRVIEKLMGDNDRLQREKLLATVKLEEEMRRGDSARSALESLQISNANLLSIHESDKNFLTKKDRRIEELRLDLEAERTRREKAERDTRESRRERDEVVERLRRDATEDKQQVQKSTSQYDVLSRSWKSMEERYEKQISKVKSDLISFQQEVEADQRKLAKLEILLEQLAREGDKSRKAKEKLLAEFQEYKMEQESGLQDIRQKAEMNDVDHDQTLRQMQSMLGEMRYVVNIKKNVYRDVDEQE